MLIDLSLEEMDYIANLVKKDDPNPLQRPIALKLGIAAMYDAMEEYAEKTAAPDPD